MNLKARVLRFLGLLAFAALAVGGLTGVAGAHGGHDHHRPPSGNSKLEPITVLQLEAVRNASARFHDVEKAKAAGYVDIRLFVPNMGWHYMKEKLVDGRFDPEEPELLVYSEDECGNLRLVAVEYAVPLELSKKAPFGFVGRADQWDANQQFQLWTLHAWIWEWNPDGVFAAFNPRVP